MANPSTIHHLPPQVEVIPYADDKGALEFVARSHNYPKSDISLEGRFVDEPR